MGRLRLSFTERRRKRLAFRVKSLDAVQMEPRSLITDPLNLFAASLGIPLVGNVITSSDGGGNPEAR